MQQLLRLLFVSVILVLLLTGASFIGGGSTGDATTTGKLSQFAATTSAELAGVISDEQGSSGGFVRATSPTLTTPVLGIATITSVNKVAITAPATSATLTIVDGKTVTLGNSCLDTKFVRKTGNESVTSSDALQDDDHLLFAIGASEVWEFRFTILASSASTTPDLAVDLAGPSGSTGGYTTVSNRTSTTTLTNDVGVAGTTTYTSGATTVAVGLTNSFISMLSMSGVIVNSTNAGNLTLRWAQNVSNGTASTILANSYLIACRVA